MSAGVKVKLTWQQRAALRAIGHEEHSPGEDVCEAIIALEGITPWRPCDNLVDKGLATKTGWEGPEEGWCFSLTDEGRRLYQQLFGATDQGEGDRG